MKIFTVYIVKNRDPNIYNKIMVTCSQAQ